MFINYRISIDYLLCWTAKLCSCPPRCPFWRQCKKGLLINLTIKRLVYCWCFERRNFVTEKDEMPDEAPSSERKTKCLMKDLPQRERQNAWWMHAFAQNVKTSQSVYRQYTDVLIAANTVFMLPSFHATAWNDNMIHRRPYLWRYLSNLHNLRKREY